MPKPIVSDFNLPESLKRGFFMSLNLLLNLGADLIERQRGEVVVVYTDIKLCRKEILEASDVNPGI